MAMLPYLQVVSAIFVERFLIVHNEGIGPFFCPKIWLLNILFQVCTILVNQYALFFYAKYQDLQLYIADYENAQLF